MEHRLEIFGILLSLVLFAIVKFIVNIYVSIMMRVQVAWLAPMPDGPKIIAANHPSVSDPFIVANMLKKRSFIFIIGYVFELVFLGACLRRMGHIPVVEGAGQKALDRGLELLKKGETVVIFPEGLVSPQCGTFNPARTGVARLALASGAPVVPIGIHLDEGHMRRFTMNWHGKSEPSGWYPRGPYYMTVGKALTFHGDAEDRPLVRQTAEAIMERIIDLALVSERRMELAAQPLTQLI